MFPTQVGPLAFLEEGYTDQNQNWSGTAAAPANHNDDQRIRTSVTSLGAQYLFSRSWDILVVIPHWDRELVTTVAHGTVATLNHGALADIRVKGTYTGFSADLSTGISLGLKLPTGDSSYSNFDADTEIGSGSTDLLLGAYHLGSFAAESRWSWSANAQWQQPLQHKSSYRPGSELDASGGIYYGGLHVGSVRVTPVLQLVASYRGHDGGPDGDPVNTGYVRAFISPGLELDAGRMHFYADVALPVYTNVSGNQLVAPALFKLNVSIRL